MLDLSRIIVAAEVLKLAAGMGGSAEHVLRSTIERCENAPFVRVAGDLKVQGDLDLDWHAPDWKSGKHCGLVVEGNLEVGGSLTNFNLNGGPALVVLGNARARNAVHGGSSWLIAGDFHAEETFFGVYNDGYAYIGGNLHAKAVINQDHDITVIGRTIGATIDEEHGHALLVDELLLEDEPGVDWDLALERAGAGEPLLRKTPRIPDIRKAAEDPNSSLLAAAIASGADVESRDDGGNTPLLLAVPAGLRDNTKLLLDAGADVKAVNARGATVAHMLAYSDDPKMFDLVLAHRPPLDRPDREGKTPMMQALEYLNLACVRALHERGVAFPPPSATESGYPYSLYLAESSRVELLKYLIAEGVAIDWRDTSDFIPGKTLLHEAAWRGNARSVALLTKAGAKVDARDERGRTPLLLMLELAPAVLAREPEETLEVTKLLLAAGADPLAKGGAGKDALDLAAAYPDTRVLRATLDAAIATGRLDAARRASFAARLSPR